MSGAGDSRPKGLARRGRVLAVLVALVSLSTVRADEPTIRQRIESAARELPFFDWSDFLDDRLDKRSLPSNTPVADRDRYLNVLGALLDDWRGVGRSESSIQQDVVPLLASSDARVRTLAMALLFDTENPKWLPLIADRRADEAGTFPMPF